MTIGFRCPRCGSETDVVQTVQLDGEITRRRRCAKRCGGYRYTVELDRDSSEEALLRDRLTAALDIIERYRRAVGAAPASDEVDVMLISSRRLVGGQ